MCDSKTACDSGCTKRQQASESRTDWPLALACILLAAASCMLVAVFTVPLGSHHTWPSFANVASSSGNSRLLTTPLPRPGPLAEKKVLNVQGAREIVEGYDAATKHMRPVKAPRAATADVPMLISLRRPTSPSASEEEEEEEEQESFGQEQQQKVQTQDDHLGDEEVGEEQQQREQLAKETQQEKVGASARPTPIGGLPGNIVKDFENKERTADRSGKPVIQTAKNATGIPLSSLTAVAATKTQPTGATTLKTVTLTPSLRGRNNAVGVGDAEGARTTSTTAKANSSPAAVWFGPRPSTTAAIAGAAHNGTLPKGPKRGPKHGGEGHNGLID